jgi:hypothetical protein
LADVSAASKSVFHPFSRSCKDKGPIMGQEPLIRIVRSKIAFSDRMCMWRLPFPEPKAVMLAGSPPRYAFEPFGRHSANLLGRSWQNNLTHWHFRRS